MISFVSGDILQTEAQYLAHGVAEGNQEGLGTGLALKISTRWPVAQSAFKRYARTGRFTGGSIWVFPPGQGSPGIIYLATQPDMYHATLPFLRKALRALAVWARRSKATSVALPKIASGLGKLSWEDEVRPLLLQHLKDVDCKFLVYEHFTLDMERGHNG
jgi:O-acetyl-ADP-ribose deacetylase (regulator of RNase III)